MIFTILKNGIPIATDVNDEVGILNDWVYDQIESITGDGLLALDVAAWAEMAASGESYKMDDFDIILTVTEIGYK